VQVLGEYGSSNYTLYSGTIQDSISTYGNDALFSVLMIVITVTFFGLRQPELAVVTNLISLWLAYGMRLFNVGVMSITTIIGLTISGIVVILVMRK
jgi:hypothetical protein